MKFTKFRQISHVIFGTKSQFFFKLCITPQCQETYSLYFFIYNFICLGQKEPIRVQVFGLSTAHFTSHKSVFLYILHYLSVSWHIIPLRFSSWNILCIGQKKSIKSTIFQNFECFNEISLNSSCHFRNHKVREFKFCIAVQYHERQLLCIF